MLRIKSRLTFCSMWDIPGFLGRDVQKCREFAALWLQDEALTRDAKVSLGRRYAEYC